MFGQVEQPLLNSIRKDSAVDKIETFQANFKGDYDTNSLMAKLELLPVICGEFQPINLGDVLKVIQSSSHGKRELIRNVVVIIRIVLTNGATSATTERSFSILRRLKTWLRSAMTQKRFEGGISGRMTWQFLNALELFSP